MYLLSDEVVIFEVNCFDGFVMNSIPSDILFNGFSYFFQILLSSLAGFDFLISFIIFPLVFFISLILFVIFLHALCTDFLIRFPAFLIVLPILFPTFLTNLIPFKMAFLLLL